MSLLAPIVAAAATGGQLFARGVDAFKRSDFESAVRYFREARSAGVDLPTLYYNLGASLYKLGRFAEAEQTFRACARDPIWAPLANYNAGLSAYRGGRRTVAASYFDRAWRTADSDEVRALALTMLERTDPAAARRARGAIALNVGYNDNVTLTADSQTLQTTSEADNFSEILASATGRWDKDTLRWDASLYDLRYTSLHDNNITSIALGVGKPIKITPWYTDLSARWEYALRDGHRFQEIVSLRFGGARDRPDRGDLRVGVQLSNIDTLDRNFAFLDGTRQQVDVSLGQRLAKARTRFGVTFERSDRADLTTANEFFSFSRIRYALWFAGSWPLSGYWQLEPTVRYARSRYADPDRRASGIVATREDKERQLGLRATYRLTAMWRMLGELSYIHTDSNFSEFSYSQRAIWIGAKRRF